MVNRTQVTLTPLVIPETWRQEGYPIGCNLFNTDTTTLILAFSTNVMNDDLRV